MNLTHRISTKNLTCSVYHPDDGPHYVELEDRELGWKYNILLYKSPEEIGKELKRIAAWLETLT